MGDLLSVSLANALIEAGKRLHIAGEEAALRSLKQGDWIGGTIPYFLTPHGGLVDRERVFVTELPPSITGARISLLSGDQLEKLPEEIPDNGFSLVILPGMSEIHTKYALAAEELPGIFDKPIIGWVSGVHLDELGKVQPKVINGQTGEMTAERLAVLHAQLADSSIATVGIINVFEQGSGDKFIFDKTGFSGDQCLINGSRGNFYDYMMERKLDVRFPLVADRSGATTNVSFQSVDDENRVVKFYAPVVEGIEYRQAAPIDDYRSAFAEQSKDFNAAPAFSCNCILNYLYGKLEGSQPITIGGPATFGEIAYVLLNQTMVYLDLHQIGGKISNY
jgi:hypothetical protein